MFLLCFNILGQTGKHLAGLSPTLLLKTVYGLMYLTLYTNVVLSGGILALTYCTQ